MDLVLCNIIITLLLACVNSSSIDLLAAKFFLQSPSQYIWSQVANGSVAEKSISPACYSQLSEISSAIKSERLWPYQFIDSSANLPSGFLDGTLSSLGDYDQCLAIESPSQGTVIRGSYCMVKFTRAKRTYSSPVENEIADGLFLYSAIPLSVAICLPDACTSERDIRSLLAPASQFAQVSQTHEIICDSSESDSRRLFTLTWSQLVAR